MDVTEQWGSRDKGITTMTGHRASINTHLPAPVLMTVVVERDQRTEAFNGRLEHLRGSALGFRNLTDYIPGSLVESGGNRPRLHPASC
ncbi:hypothetical protein [Kocuria kalidii]|uniref:hypothetical protein n=1 Tax=Kocuria kalidii TaxID=3376283 RepID=UPI0037888838